MLLLQGDFLRDLLRPSEQQETDVELGLLGVILEEALDIVGLLLGQQLLGIDQVIDRGERAPQ